MKAWLAHLPDDDALAAGLTNALADPHSERVTIISRQRNPNASAFPSEMVTCRLANGEHLRLFCKYDNGRDHGAHGHRGGVAYEAEVYRDVLAPAALEVPHFYAAAAGPGGEVWLVVACVERAVRLRDSHDPNHWTLAADWSGRCHAVHNARSGEATTSLLNTYDLPYYVGWARRTVEYAGDFGAEFPWLTEDCRRAETAFSELVQAPQTLVHGEYYPKNLLICDARVFPVDWESAALAPGEIDLATLTDGCDPDVTRHCERAYQLARWPQGAPPAFERTLSVARLYVHLRWLGDQPGGKLRRRFWRYEEVRALGTGLGLL
jgi:hypothetical protein